MQEFAFNDKQMEIFRATWPNLGWAAREHNEKLNRQKDDGFNTDNSTEERVV